MKQKNNSLLVWIGQLSGIVKLLTSLLLAVIIYISIPNDPAFHTNFMISWDIFSFMMVLLSWITFLTISTDGIREQCNKQDESRFVIFVLIVVSTLASLAEGSFLLAGKTTHFQLAVAITGMLMSWLLVHSIFAFRYAHLYYGNAEHDITVHAGGLEFPGDKRPDYLDFAYFSFVVGMTFQVSDVQVTSKRIRRMVLLHGLISFIFNTFFVALTINVIAGLRGLVNLRKG